MVLALLINLVLYFPNEVVILCPQQGGRWGEVLARQRSVTSLRNLYILSAVYSVVSFSCARPVWGLNAVDTVPFATGLTLTEEVLAASVSCKVSHVSAEYRMQDGKKCSSVLPSFQHIIFITFCSDSNSKLNLVCLEFGDGYWNDISHQMI